MIGRLQGTLLVVKPPRLLVDVMGVGYEVEVPMSTLYQLPSINQIVTLLIHHVVREDAQLLYGFYTDLERQWFRQLLKISGVGPKLALSVLSGLSVEELQRTIMTQDAVRLTQIPGVGKKTAERLMLELKQSVSQFAALSDPLVSLTPSVKEEVIEALLSLGYQEREANKATELLPESVSVEEGIRAALKSLMRGGGGK
ncbi:MAG: Holliday junction branch migration protein RuvA [Ferrovum sp. 37-45-19]|uniref:Holliday junction branch migration protein RuvA n=1 Tax=Ferrovum sp. JA12 TaxID=1356299 RepID=UPI00070397E9|nr:Holliday junction branch migration protein RuvA [Ferrovum sp. JA12]OYV80108.1 MAG: Holliday junction branch migration protein RuvA [Ferrovum sp. 21-44-67]OYV93331.1 MAG: Holliday junction branch migration protein RuvA [Ferrovum sp. 37-45-19]OZB33533.1 MAG: Holliday junction branch migration protein RuvA [Ferrovum sp. 34-44-207]HQT82347.1 Holliday junction branch migration protein RuvA [Ferrovaceae bacterium]KRH77998.1 holliday junction ATP-dependent DNA helicase RuvA [Ferrovum sp. JA12]